jgi:cytidine deaminase
MKKITHSIDFQAFTEVSELTEGDRELLAAARECLKTAYAPYSKFHVGAAIRLENEAIVTGTNIENASFPMCICAEPSALAAAKFAFPDEKPLAMAISVENRAPNGAKSTTPGMPCGACRQIIFEAECRYQSPIRLILQGETGDIWIFDSVKRLLPFAFGPGDLG